MGLPEISSFRPADAGEGELVECYEVARAAHVADFPGRPFQPYSAFADQMRRPERLRGRQQIWVARGDGKIAGLAIVALPKRENRRLTITTVTVPPSLRRQGSARRCSVRPFRRRGLMDALCSRSARRGRVIT